MDRERPLLVSLEVAIVPWAAPFLALQHDKSVSYSLKGLARSLETLTCMLVTDLGIIRELLRVDEGDFDLLKTPKCDTDS